MADSGANASDCHTLGTVGEMLRCFRERRLWTQATLSERAGLPEKTISSLETGARRRPHLTTLELLADALELGAAEREALRARREDRPPAKAPRLPLPATPLVDREESTAQVIALLDQSGVRLLTLTGPGGIGKTRLALHVAERLTDRFPDGVYFADLSALRDPALVPGAVAQAIGLRVAGGQSSESAVLDACADRRMLLVLDNLEQVLDAALFVDRLVAGSAGLVALVTSRERLLLTREHLYHVGVLAPPEAVEGASPDSVLGSEAGQLFVQRARMVQPAFAVTADNAADVAALCAGLDGIPLAIELAAARLAHVGTPVALRQRLDRSLAWLTSGLRDQTERHRTMRAAIEWSYDALSPADQRLFRRLAVFAGGFTFDAAEVVASAAHDDGDDTTLDGIATLVEKNLLQIMDGPDGGTRYRMLEPIREYAGERLHELGDEPQARAAHAAAYLTLAERGEQELSGPNQRAWLARLEAEDDNFRAALTWAIAREDAALALRMGSALWRFWATGGRVDEGRRFLDRALALKAPAEPAVRVKGLRRLGNLAVEQSDYSGARAAFEASLALAGAMGDATAWARALSSLGYVAYNLGDYGQARAHLEAALAAWQDPAGASDRAVALYTPGAVAFAEGAYAEAEARYQASLQLRRALGDEFGAAHAGVGLADVARLTGRLDEAGRWLEEALGIFRSGNERQGVGYVLLGLAHLAQVAGDSTTALTHARAALARCRTLGDLHAIVDALEALALIHWDRGEPEIGARLAGSSAAWRRARGVPAAPAWRETFETALAGARATTSDRVFAAAFTAGEAMPVERLASWYLASMD